MTEWHATGLHKFRLWLRWNTPIRWVFWWYSVIRYYVTGDCGHGCGYMLPYGFVPEADCPIHDDLGIRP